jgi:hypothetical protein
MKHVLVAVIMIPLCIVLAIGTVLVAFSLFGIDQISTIAYPQGDSWSA